MKHQVPPWLMVASGFGFTAEQPLLSSCSWKLASLTLSSHAVPVSTDEPYRTFAATICHGFGETVSRFQGNVAAITYRDSSLEVLLLLLSKGWIVPLHWGDSAGYAGSPLTLETLWRRTMFTSRKFLPRVTATWTIRAVIGWLHIWWKPALAVPPT